MKPYTSTRYLKSIKATIAFCLLFATSIGFWACKKQDFAFKNPDNSQLVEHFFTLPANASPEIVRIASQLKQLHDKTGFIAQLADREGLPIWDKTILNLGKTANRSIDMATASVTTNTANNSSTNDTIIYIPLVHENTKYVNSFIYAKLNGNIHLSLYRGREYEKQEFGDLSGKPNNTDHLALQIMMLNEKVFGHTAFALKDERLFKNFSATITTKRIDSTKRVLKLSSDNNGSQNTAGIITMGWQYIDYTICVTTTSNHCTGDVVCQPICDGCSLCTSSSTSCEHRTVAYFVEPPEGPQGGSNPSGGGGGGSPVPAPNVSQPCNPTPELDNGLIPCEEGNTTGWTIVPNPPSALETPCEKAKKGAKKMDTLFTNSKADSVLASIPNLATETNEKGFPIFQNFNINPNNHNDTTFTTVNCGKVQTGTTTGISYTVSYNPNIKMQVAALHTHPPSGYTAQSADDMYILIANAADNDPTHYAGNFVAAANGSQYAITITDPASAAAFLATKANFLDDTTKSWKKDSDIGKAFESARIDFEKTYKGNPNKKNLAYEMAMAAVLKEYNVGITLNKKDANGNFKPLVVNTITPNPNKPNNKIYIQDCL